MLIVAYSESILYSLFVFNESINFKIATFLIACARATFRCFRIEECRKFEHRRKASRFRVAIVWTGHSDKFPKINDPVGCEKGPRIFLSFLCRKYLFVFRLVECLCSLSHNINNNMRERLCCQHHHVIFAILSNDRLFSGQKYEKCSGKKVPAHSNNRSTEIRLNETRHLSCDHIRTFPQIGLSSCGLQYKRILATHVSKVFFT